MKVLHCLHSSKIGGIQRLVTDLSLEQKRQGLDVSIMLDKGSQDYYEFMLANGVRVILSGIKNGYELRIRKIFHLKKLLQKYDIVHFHRFNLMLSICGMSSKKVYTIHGLSKGVRKEMYLKYFSREILKKHFLNRVDYFVANSEYTLQQAKLHYKLNSVRTKVIKNGITLTRPTLTMKLHQEPEFTIGMVSSFTPRKRIDRLIDAFELFIRRGGNGKLILVGGGELYDSVIRTINLKRLCKYVVLPGYTTKVTDYYKRFDICVHPSDNEGFGLVAVEAYSVGIPIIVFNDSGGLKEIVEPFDPENVVNSVEDLAERLLHYAKHREEISIKATARIKYAILNYSIERMEREYYDLYSETLHTIVD